MFTATLGFTYEAGGRISFLILLNTVDTTNATMGLKDDDGGEKEGGWCSSKKDLWDGEGEETLRKL